MLINFLKREFENDNYDNCLVTAKGVKAMQKVFSYETYKIFKNTFFYRTPLLCWLLLVVKCVNQRKHTLNVYAAENEMTCLNDNSKVSVSRKGVFI